MINSGGSIMQLIAMHEATPPDPNNVEQYNRQATDKYINDFAQVNSNTYKYNLPHMADAYRPDYIIVNQNDTASRLKEIIFSIGGNHKWSIDIKFLQQFHNDVIDTSRAGKIVYKPHLDKFIENGIFYTVHESSYIELVFENNITESAPQLCQVIGTYIYYDSQLRNDIIHGNIRQPVNFVTPLKSNIITSTSNNMSLNICCNGQVNGIFIETMNINAITTLKLTINEYYRIDITNSLLFKFQFKRYGNLLYIPLSDLDTWNLQYNSHNYTGLKDTDDVRLEITSSEQLGYVQLRTLVQNALKTTWAQIPSQSNLSIAMVT
jgi:hypothetical protein